MRIDTKEVPGLRDLSLDSADAVDFKSDLPDAETIRLAWGNPDLERIVSESGLGESMTTNAARANRWVQGISAVNLGVPSAVLPAFEQAVWKWGPANWRSFGEGTLTSAMDLGLEGMGAVPIIGVAAKFAIKLVDTIVRMSRKKKPAPQAIRYLKALDQDRASDALRSYYGGDLRRVFMPPAERVTAWRVEPTAEGGFSVKYEGDSSAGGFGVVPGTNIVAGQLNSSIHWTAENYLPCNKAGTVCSDPSGTLTSSQRASVRRDWDAVFEGTISSSGDATPSLRRVGSALWSAVSSTQTAAVFDLDTRGITFAWEAWADAANGLASEAMNGGVKMYLDRYVGFQALQRSTKVGFYGVAGQWDLGQFAAHRMAEIKRVQNELLDTLVVAYCSESQPAFRSSKLRQKLRDRRARLLTHMARWKVSSADIPDADYRAEFETATAGDRPLAAPGLGEFEGKPERVSPVAGPSETGGSAGGLFLLAGAALAAGSLF